MGPVRARAELRTGPALPLPPRNAAGRPAPRAAHYPASSEHRYLLQSIRLRTRRDGVLLVRLQLARFLGGEQAHCDKVVRRDELVADTEASGAIHRVAKPDRPGVLDQDQRGCRVVRDVADDVPRLLLGEERDSLCSELGACLGSRDDAFLALDAEADERAYDRAELDCIVLRQRAEMLDLDRAFGVLVHSQRVDDLDRVGCTQPLQFRNNLTVEVGLVKAEHDELNGSNCHLHPFLATALTVTRAVAPGITRTR